MFTYQCSTIDFDNYTKRFIMKIILSIVCLIAALALTESHGHDHAHYKFAYGVHDPHTHDKKSQHEHRNGHHVTGEYELKEPDGTHRVVKYIAGPHTGFEAIVERRGHAQHPDHHGHHYGATSYVDVTHWGDQGDSDEHDH